MAAKIYPLEDLLNKMNSNLSSMIDELGIILPKDCENDKERCEYEIKFRYEKIFFRPKDIRPPKIKFTTHENQIKGSIRNRKYYKATEIIQEYEIPKNCIYWENTDDLIDKIIDYQVYVHSLNINSKKEMNVIISDHKLEMKNNVYSDYKVIQEIEENELIFSHPSKVVEAETLFNINLPPLNEEFKKLIKERKWFGLSKLQTETVVYACFSHEHYLSNGERRGYLIGDGTGIGKGRELCGIVSYNYDFGRKKSLWFTVSNSLIVSTIRDINDTREDKDIKVFMPPTLCTDKIEENEGILFMTYKKLISNGSKKNPKTRYEQICDWLGEDFDGVIVFDECHSAKSFSENKSSKTGKIVHDIQKLYKNARIVYSSASSASEIKNLGYMGRLGIWDGSFSNSFETFKKCLSSGGVGAIELLSCELKRRGCFCARNLSYDEVEFETHEIFIDENQEKMYEEYSNLWNELLELTDKKNKIIYWNSHQRFFMHYILSIKIEKCVEIVKQDLLKNECAVIGLFSTGESSIKRCKDDEFSTLKDIVENYAKNLKNNSIINKISSMKFPQNPIDDLVERLGGINKVAEISGRNVKVVKKNGKNVLVNRNSEIENLKETEDFQSGKKNVAIITEAASLGISLHDYGTNSKKRNHIIIQLPWSADKALQQLGRTHRSNENTKPRYKFLFTKIAGEKRLVSTMANRLKLLGAITNGDRRASPNSAIFSNHILCPEISKFVISNLNFNDNVPQEIQDSIYSKKCIKNFLNKLLGLSPKLQNKIFQQFMKLYNQEFEDNKNKGLKLQDLEFLDEEPIKNQIIYTPENGLCETRILTYAQKGCVIVGTVLPFVQEIIENLNAIKKNSGYIYGGLQIVFVLLNNKWMVGTLFSNNLKKTLINCLSRKVENSITEKYSFLGKEILSLFLSKIIKSKLSYVELVKSKNLLKIQLEIFYKEIDIQFLVIKDFFDKNNLKMDFEKERRIKNNRNIYKLKKEFLFNCVKANEPKIIEELNSELPNKIAKEMKSYYPLQILN